MSTSTVASWTPGEALTRVVELTRSLTGGESALYLLDIDGSRAVRVGASDTEFPEALEHGIGVGKDIPTDSGPIIEALLQAMRPGAKIALLLARGRGVGILATMGDEQGLRTAAEQSAPWIEVADGFTDEILRSRLRRSINTEGIIQQNLLPPEVSALGGAEVAGSVLPAYDVGGDWFDHAVNIDGAWLGIGDGVGKGVEATALATVSIGAFRAARLNGATLEAAVREMDMAVRTTSRPNAFVTSVIAHCDTEAHHLRWVVCGHPKPIVVRRDGSWYELDCEVSPPVGLFPEEHEPRVCETELDVDDLLMLYTDGVIERRDGDGNVIGMDQLLSSVADAARSSAAFSVASVQNAVLKASPEPLKDDSTLLAFRLRA